MPTSSHDLVRGTTGNDTLDGGHGNDVMSGWLYMPQRQHAEINADTGDDLMIGGSGNDNIFAGGGADTLYGGHGRDYLVGGAGGDAIHGGTGNDYFVFAWADLGRTKLDIEPGDVIMDWHEGDRIDVSQFASRAQPRVTWEQVAPGVAEVTVVVPGLTAAATRYTTATFEVRGADVATLDRGDFILGNGDDVHAPPRQWESQAQGQAARLYDAVLDRIADPDGLRYWTGVLDSGGLSYADVANGFIRSSEFQAKYGATSNAGFVELLYANVLDRQAEGEGRDFWVDALASGRATREQVVQAFSESPEHVQGFTADMGLPW